MNRIRKGDQVIITTGKSKGHIGEVLKVKGEKVLVQGGNIVKKHVKPNPNLNEQGGIKEVEALINASNVALYNTETGKADKVGFKVVEESGKQVKVRYFKSNDKIVDPS